MRHFLLRGEVLIALGIVVLGLLMAAGTLAIPPTSGYERIGPAAYPWAISIALMGVGGILVREALQRSRGAELAVVQKFHFVPFAFISLGLILQLLLLERAGFIIAAATLFVCTARAFGARHWIVTVTIALSLAIVVYLGFTRGLDLNLPAGILQAFF